MLPSSFNIGHLNLKDLYIRYKTIYKKDERGLHFQINLSHFYGKYHDVNGHDLSITYTGYVTAQDLIQLKDQGYI